MSKIVFKTIDNIVYSGDLDYLGKEDFIVKNLSCSPTVPKEERIKSLDNEEEIFQGRVIFRINNVIWYYQK